MMKNKVIIRQVRFEEAQPKIEQIRRTVFIEEQQVPEKLEWDGLDRDAIQLLAFQHNGEPVATARMLSDGHIGRLAVLPAWRHRGIGRAMLATLLDIAQHQALPKVYLNAQLNAIGFYTRAGFQLDGSIFMDAGIPHKRMLLELNRID